MMPKILLADDHTMVLTALETLLTSAYDIVGKGVADCGSLVEAITMAARLAHTHRGRRT